MLLGAREPDAPAGHRLRIETAQTPDGVTIVIADDGPGMPAEVLKNAFEPLFSTKGVGAGLGLPVVRKIVEQHNGSIAIESDQGEGTRVILGLPSDARPSESR